MLRVFLLVSSLLALTAGVSSAAVVFYTDPALWTAANTATVSDNFNQVDFSGTAASPYLSSTGVLFSSPYANVHVDVNTQTGRNIVTGAGSGDGGIANGPSFAWSPDFSTGRYLNTADYATDSIYNIHQWGRQEQQWNAETGQWEDVRNESFQSYAGDVHTVDMELQIPAGFSSVGFDLGQVTGISPDRPFEAIVTTFLGETATFTVTNAYGALSFFGFQAPTGDTISTIRIASLFLPIPAPNIPAWSYTNGGTYRTRVWNETNGDYWDQYQLGLDNLYLGNASAEPPPPPPPDGGGGEAPEPATWMTLAGGLLLLSRFRHRVKLAR